MQTLLFIRDNELGLIGPLNKGPNDVLQEGTFRINRGEFGRRLYFDLTLIRPSDQNEGSWVIFPEAMERFVQVRVSEPNSSAEPLVFWFPFAKTPKDFFDNPGMVYHVNNRQPWHAVPAETLNASVDVERIYGIELSLNPEWGQAKPETFYIGIRGEDVRVLEAFTWNEFTVQVPGPVVAAKVTPAPVA